MARPSKLTPEVRDRFLEAVRGGNYRDAAAHAAGVSVKTMRGWCQAGKRAASGPLREFWVALLEAEADAEIRMVSLVVKAAHDDPAHARWWLERKFPERWGRDTLIANELRRLLREMQQKRGGERGRR